MVTNDSARLPKIKPWLLAARPKTLPASLVPVLVAFAIVYPTGSLRVLPAAAVLLAAVLIQIICNYANDVLDFEKGADTAERVGPTRATQSGQIDSQTLKRVTAALIGVCLLIGSYLVAIGGIPILIIGVLSLIFAVLYTAGPFALAYLGLGELFVIIFFGPVAVAGTEYLFRGEFQLVAILAGSICGLISAAILSINNLRDIDSDRKSRKFTLAVRFGTRFARVEYAALLLAASVIGFSLPWWTSGHPWSWLSGLFILPAAPAVGEVLSPHRPPVLAAGAELNLILEKTGKLLVLFGILFVLSY